MKKTLNMVFQSESSECALAALVMILNYHNNHTSLAELREQHSVGLSGLSLGLLIKIASYYHLICHVIRIEPDELVTLRLPAILHWELNHFVVLKKVFNNKVIVHDPGKGILTISMSELSEKFTGIAIECIPGEEFQLSSRKKVPSLFKGLKNVKEIKPLLFKLSIFTLLYQLFLLLVPRYLGISVDQIIPSRNYHALFELVAGFVALRVLMLIAKIFKLFCIHKLDVEISLNLGAHICQHIMRLPLDYFEKRYLGDILNRFNSVEQIRQVISGGLVEGVIGGLLAMTTFVMMASLNIVLALATLFFILIFIIIKLKMHKRQKIKTSEMLTAKSQEQSSFIENIRGIQPIKIFSKENERILLWINRHIQFLRSAYQANSIKSNTDNIKEFILGLELITVIFLASIKVINQEITIGLFYTYLFYRQQFADSLLSFIDKSHDFKMLSIYGERLHDITLCGPEKENLFVQSIPENFSIEVRDLSFQYSAHQPVLFSQLNFTIQAGEAVAIVGKSGNGKTTLLKIMMGLLKPTSGEIRIGDLPINNVLTPRQYMASVMQDDCLLSGTIAQNIGFFSSSMNLEKVYECARLSGIYDEISRMPMKFNTLVGDMGTTLSGGQKQRVLLARALYADPKILFLDEATSHLDVEKEREVNRAIKSLGITCVMIAHRQETILMADRVIEITRRVCSIT